MPKLGARPLSSSSSSNSSSTRDEDEMLDAATDSDESENDQDLDYKPPSKKQKHKQSPDAAISEPRPPSFYSHAPALWGKRHLEALKAHVVPISPESFRKHFGIQQVSDKLNRDILAMIAGIDVDDTVAKAVRVYRDDKSDSTKLQRITFNLAQKIYYRCKSWGSTVPEQVGRSTRETIWLSQLEQYFHLMLHSEPALVVVAVPKHRFETTLDIDGVGYQNLRFVITAESIYQQAKEHWEKAKHMDEMKRREEMLEKHNYRVAKVPMKRK